MSQERPEALLKSALEKIVYFEARASQLSNDLEQAVAERERVRTELAQASQREIELRRVIAELEVRTTRAHAEREESARLAEALRRERAELLGKILDASRLQQDTVDPFDLASFIAELRSEVLLRREAAGTPEPVRVTPAKEAVPLAPEPSHLMQEAASLKAQGRLSVSADELAVLERAHPFAGRSDETLFGFSVRELSAPDAASRARAAERLTALAHPAAAPALATALHAETDASVKVALLTALATLAKSEAVPVVVPQLSSSSPDVRIAALKALLKLAPLEAGPHLAAAVKDPDATVRRRASLLALGLRGPSALELGETAIRDDNADVRSLAALVLGASGDESARPWLMQAMRDPELRVRRSASQALSRLLGQDVSQLVELDDAQRRREVRRLAQVPSNPVKAKVLQQLPRQATTNATGEGLAPRATAGPVAAAPALRTLAVPALTTSHGSGGPASRHDAVMMTSGYAEPAAPRPLPAPTSARPLAPGPAAHAASRVAVLEVDEAPRAADPAVVTGVLTELRAAIRGQSADALAGALSTSTDAVRAACAELLSRGAIVRRGHKYFIA